MRHNNIRDFEAHLLKEVCKDVRIEPELMSTGNVETGSGSNKAEKARLDVSAVGVWSSMERTFLDVRVMHPNSPSYSDKSIEQIYLQNEREKKAKYNNRILQVEKGSCTPLIFFPQQAGWVHNVRCTISVWLNLFLPKEVTHTAMW